jgi:hypothetical protein
MPKTIIEFSPEEDHYVPKMRYHSALYYRMKLNPEDLYFYEYPLKIIMQFKIAVVMLRQAEVYAHRIDWLLSGDDSEESFIKRLVKDLNKLYRNRKRLSQHLPHYISWISTTIGVGVMKSYARLLPIN